MINEEVILKIHEEFVLRGLSPQTEESYLCALHLSLCYYENRTIETMGEQEIREFLLYQLDSGKCSGTVDIYNSALRFIFGAVMGKKLNYQLIPRRRHHREFPAMISKTEIVYNAKLPMLSP